MHSLALRPLEHLLRPMERGLDADIRGAVRTLTSSSLLSDLEQALGETALVAFDGSGEVCFLSRRAEELLSQLECQPQDLLTPGLPAPKSGRGVHVELTTSGQRSSLALRSCDGGTVLVWTRVFPRAAAGGSFDGAVVRFDVDDPLASDAENEQLMHYAEDLAEAQRRAREKQEELEQTLERLAEALAEVEHLRHSHGEPSRGVSSPRGRGLRSEPTAPEAGSAGPMAFHGIVSGDTRMLDLFHVIRSVGPRDVTVLLHGESGVGKELVARAIHLESDRTERPFVAVNCATLVPSLAESQLFGHVRGAFTGAVRDQDGVFTQADGGTLFLDEVAELPPELQSKLLRVLQEGTLTPLGGNSLKHVNVRLVAASHRSLDEEVKAGRFRADLMYRLRVMPLEIPPLRNRRNDLPFLLRHFIDRLNARGGHQVSSVSPAVVRRVLEHDWPGNVRELENAVEHAFALVHDHRIEEEHLPQTVRRTQVAGAVIGPKAGNRLPQIDEEAAIRQALEECGGQVEEAAKRLGMSRTTFWRRRRHHGL